MVISYYGEYFVKIQLGDTVIAADPFSKKSAMKPIHFGARIGLVSMDHPDMNGVEHLAHGDKVPFIISGPGEYDVGGISISGFPSPERKAKEDEESSGKKGPALLNTIYTVDLEGMRLCFLGALRSTDLSSELFESIGEVDIVFVPVAGGDVLTPAEAEKIAVKLDAKLIIPLAHSGMSDKQLKTFLKEAGDENVKPVDKLTLKKKDLEGKEGDVVVLEALSHA